MKENVLAQELAPPDYRSDLIRRMFAVVVSVGFAGALAQSAWIKDQRLPRPDEWQLVLCLGSGLILILSSWEGFNRHRAKTDAYLPIFIIDLILMLLYLVVLFLSANPNVFLRLVAIVFGLYVVWDLLVFRRFGEPDSLRRCAISSVWCSGLLVLSNLANPYAQPVFSATIVALSALWFRNRSMRTVRRTLLGVGAIAVVHALSWMF